LRIINRWLYRSCGTEQAILIQYPSGDPKVTIDLLSGLKQDGGGYSFDTFIPGKFVLKFNQGLEISLDMSLLVVDPTAADFFAMRLDDLGGWDDDQMTGQIPEPAPLRLR